MSTREIKQLLHESIENIDDGAFLLAVKQIIDRKYKPGDIPMLAEWQLERIDASKDQIKRKPPGTSIFYGERLSFIFARAEVCAVDLPDDP